MLLVIESRSIPSTTPSLLKSALCAERAVVAVIDAAIMAKVVGRVVIVNSKVSGEFHGRERLDRCTS